MYMADTSTYVPVEVEVTDWSIEVSFLCTWFKLVVTSTLWQHYIGLMSGSTKTTKLLLRGIVSFVLAVLVLYCICTLIRGKGDGEWRRDEGEAAGGGASGGKDGGERRSFAAERDGSDSTGEENGGWELADAETESLYRTSVCDIDRKSVTELSTEEFEKVYRFKRPLILKFPNGAKDWTNPSKWTMVSLTEEYGHRSVMVGNSRDIIKEGSADSHLTTVRAFTEQFMRRKDAIGDKYYVYDKFACNAWDLTSTLTVPQYLNVQEEEDNKVFFLGGSLSGVAFHKHTDSWHGVIYGRQRWFLYPTTTTPPGGIYPSYTQVQWYQSVYPHLTPEQRPLECVQEPGEIIYLPEGMYHASINLGDTVAIGVHKSKPQTTTEKLFQEDDALRMEIDKLTNLGRQGTAVAALKQQRKEAFETLQTLLPDNAEVQFKAGVMYGQYGESANAIRHLTRAVQMDSRYVLAYLVLAIKYDRLGEMEEADRYFQEAVQLQSRSIYAYLLYGEFLVRHDLAGEAVPLYRQALKLEPEGSTNVLKNLYAAQLKLGDTDGAAQTLVQIRDIESTLRQMKEGVCVRTHYNYTDLYTCNHSVA